MSMRDVNRIEPFMDEIKVLWKKNLPDWRFGQLMVNFICQIGDPFYLEDDEFMEAFRAFMRMDDAKEALEAYREKKYNVQKNH